MNFKTCLSTLFLFACAVICLPINGLAQETKPPAQQSMGFRGDGYDYRLTDRDFVDTPSWNQDDGEPPLSVSKAIKAARENLPRFVKNAESWKVRMVMLQSIGEEKWYYRIHFLCFGAPCRETETRSFMSIVKMDGTIVVPKKVIIEQ